MEKLCDHIFAHKCADPILKYASDLLDSLLSDTNHITKINNLIEHTYIINHYYAVIGLMQLVTNDKEWYKCNKIIEKYMIKFYQNKNLMRIIAGLLKLSKNDEHIHLCTKIIKKSQETSEVILLKKNMAQSVSIIQAELEKSVRVEIPNDMRSMLPTKINDAIDKSNNLMINRSIYFYLQRKIRDSKIRTYIEKKYMSKSLLCFNEFANLLALRHKFALALDYDNFFQYKRQQHGAESNDITYLITDLMTKIDDRTKKEIDRIHRELAKDGQNKKVDMGDIIYYHEKLKSKNKFSPLKAINVIFEHVEKLFDIKFKKISKYQSLWHSSVSEYEMWYNDTFYGYLYFDLIARQDKNIITTTYLSLSHKYIKGSKIYFPKGVLIGNFDDLEDNCVSYSEIVILFREFGHAVQNLLLNTTIGIHHSHNEFENITAQIMEFLAWEKSTIQKICSNISSSTTLSDHIIFTKYIDFGITIKLKCLNSLFDHIIHNSPSIIQLMSNMEHNKGSVICDLYKKIYKDVMSSFSNMLNLDLQYVNPNILIQETNGNEGILYGNILSEILAYTVYKSVKSGNGKKFINDVLLSNPNISIKKLIHEYVANEQVDSYDLYMTELIGYSEVDTELNINEKNKYDVTDSANYFDDNSDNIQLNKTKTVDL